MTNSTTDGLSYEEAGQAGSQVSSVWLTGSLVSQSNISGANVYSTAAVVGVNVIGTTAVSGATGLFTNAVASTALSGTAALVGNATATGSISTPSVVTTPGSPYLTGNVLNFTTETVISGGMWVTVSGATGGASVLARAAAASSNGPLGVALATVGSNATVSVLTRGLCYLTADGTVANAENVAMGAGTALNCAVAAGAGSAARGLALAGAGSNEKSLVYLF